MNRYSMTLSLCLEKFTEHMSTSMKSIDHKMATAAVYSLRRYVYAMM